MMEKEKKTDKADREEKDCVFCRFVREGIPNKIWEDADYVAFLDIRPINPGHTLLMPKKHSDYLFDLDESEYKELMKRAKKIAKILKSKLGPKKVGMAVEGFGVPHVHVHLVPLNKANELNAERARHMDQKELNSITKKIIA